MKRKLPVVLAVVLLVAADAPKEDPGKKELEKLNGAWTTASIEYNGKQHEELAKQLRFVFKGDTATVEGSAAVRKEYAKLTFKLDPSTTPKLLDLTVLAGVQKDAVMEGIYEMKDDELKICLKVLGKERPTEFASPAGASIALLVLKREKP
jgi:uncharacterized protein (TIGR03067 family)